jgi:hypothetical protein
MSIAKNLGINPDVIRIREFTINEQKLKVRVPNALEAELMEERVSNPPPELIDEKYKILSEPIINNKHSLNLSEEIKILDDDIIIGEYSIKKMALNQSKTEQRILETFKLLVPIDGYDMSNLTYKEINEDIPYPIQLEMVKKIATIISPTYEETKKK